MLASKIKFFLFVAVFMLAAKPFVGFSIVNQLPADNETHIIVKAFTKRKQEFVEESEFDIQTIMKRLANPLTGLVVLFSFLLDVIFPYVFLSGKTSINKIISDIRLNQIHSGRRYLLAGVLII